MHMFGFNPKRVIINDMTSPINARIEHNEGYHRIDSSIIRQHIADGQRESYPVEHLEIRRSSLNMRDMSEIITFCGSLSTLIVEIPNRGMIRNLIVLVLEFHKSTLKHLCLDSVLPSRPEPMGSLRQLMVL